ncbi:MAG: DUF2961 domain-containing protein, partial [Verrucomicrobia bacterium]|nr:DUF2961 domain-containing protein [Verrucomicrobiota bacterium]
MKPIKLIKSRLSAMKWDAFLLRLLLFLWAAPTWAVEWDPYAELASPETWDQLKPGQALLFAGVDPGGKNMDSGNFLRIEPPGTDFQKGDWVLAEMEGPGSITRIWMTGKNPQGDAPRIFGRIRIFIDSKDRPVVDLPMEEFFGKAKPFVPPLATPTSGAWACQVPIPFSRYCKVVVTDHQDRFAHRVNGLRQTIPHLYYQICWRKSPAGTKVKPFTIPLSKKREELIEQATAKFISTPAAADLTSHTIAPGERVEVFAAKGKGMVEELSLAAEDLSNLRIEAHWDGSSEPAVDVPAWTFFAAGLQPRPFKSLALAFDGKVHSCRLPMSFTNGARLHVSNTGNSEARVGVAVRVKQPPTA